MTINHEVLENIKTRYHELQAALGDTETHKDPERLRALGKEFHAIEKKHELAERYLIIEKALKEAGATLAIEDDLTLRGIAEEETASLRLQLNEVEKKLTGLLEGAGVERNLIMEIRPGVGGDEAEIWAAELTRMYFRFAERRGWRTKLIEEQQTSINGLKFISFEVSGEGAWSALRHEGGVNRVQRVPETEKSGRLHTSTATVAVLPVVEEAEVKINPSDLRIDTYLSSGHGGQSVQTTYSAIRIVHIPSGLVVTCQNERSQQQNKETAMKVLRARLYEIETTKRSGSIQDTRRAQVGGGDRSEKIRTYNFPQDRLTDHRLEKSWHHLTSIMDGALDEVVEATKSLKKLDS